MPAVVAQGLIKRFGKTEALRGIDLEVERATVMCVLGPNGAGKTTAVRILTTLLTPDGGSASIDGFDVVRDARSVRTRIGLTGQFAAVDERLTGEENLEHVGRLFHLGTAEARRRAGGLLERFELTDAASRVVKTYSGGMRRRLDLAMSLIAKPSVLFLDEPTTGLDPRSRLAMWDLIEELVRDGTTTLLTTQYLDEAERLADQITVIDHGTVIARGTAADLKQRVGGERVEVTVEKDDDVAGVVSLLAVHVRASGTPTVETGGRTVVVPVNSTHGVVPELVRMLDDAGIAVQDVAVRLVTLDDVFLQLTGRRTDAEDEGTNQ